MSGAGYEKSTFFEELQSRKHIRRKQLDEALEEIIKQLKGMGAEKIIVFGSYLSDNISRWSDLDIIVLLPRIKSGREWFKEIYDKLDARVPVDVFPFTKEELEGKMETSSFIRRALKEGKVIYEKGQDH